MKWGKKTSSPPSFSSSVITRVFPGSWFSKFKQTGSSLETTSGKKQPRGKLDLSTGKSSLPARRRESRFYSLDGDAYWTLSFRKDRGEGIRRNKINPLWYESDDDYLVAVSNFKSSGVSETQLPRRELERIPELDTDETEQERRCSDHVLRENGAPGDKKQNQRSKKLRGRVEWRKKAERGTGLLDEGEKESSNPEEEEEEFLTETHETDKGKEETQDSAVSDEVEDYEEDLEFQEETAYISRRSRSRKGKQNRRKARGSRSECRIQSLADMKKARTKSKKEKKEETIESSTIYNSFAVVKSSLDPKQDFRDSMMEMIKEKRISRREELEELLACYLTLNCDKHHHLIINVFQQVWFELSKAVY